MLLSVAYTDPEVAWVRLTEGQAKEQGIKVKTGLIQSFEIGIEYGGVLRYMMSHNRFRLFQQVAKGETDYGVLYLDRMAGIFQRGGFLPRQAAIGYHLLSQYVMSSAYAQVSHQLPAFHENYIVLDRKPSNPSNDAGSHRFCRSEDFLKPAV